MAKGIFKKYFFLLILLTLLIHIGAGSMKNQEIEVVGRIFVMGHEPFTQVAIELANGRVLTLEGMHEKDLRNLQGKQLMVRGVSKGQTPQGIEVIEVKEFRLADSK